MAVAPRTKNPVARDGYQNVAAKLGYGADNLSSGGTYGFNPVSRNRTLLEWAYRGSWLVGQAVDCVADDMTRAGITIDSDMPPDQIDALQREMREKCIWERLNETAKWARLYGGAVAVLMIAGQNPATPLRQETVGRGQFQGMMVLDRWMLTPSLSDPVKDFGPDFGKPSFYDIVDAPGLPSAMRIHHSRVVRLEGVDLPYWQKIAENGWGLSVVERLYDRMIAYDSASQGIAQLTYKAHLRTLKVKNLRDIIAQGGKALQSLVANVEMMRAYQSNEGLSILDGEDEFQTHQYTFSGLSDVLLQFGQQLSGALQIPLVRLFGQSPAGMNSTGESDIRNYYDSIRAQQEARLRLPLGRILNVMCRSVLGIEPPAGFGFSFAPLWQTSDAERADIATKITATVVQAADAGIVSRQIALKELRQSSRVTGIWSNVTDEDIAEAEDDPPAPSEMPPNETTKPTPEPEPDAQA